MQSSCKRNFLESRIRELCGQYFFLTFYSTHLRAVWAHIFWKCQFKSSTDAITIINNNNNLFDEWNQEKLRHSSWTNFCWFSLDCNRMCRAPKDMKKCIQSGQSRNDFCVYFTLSSLEIQWLVVLYYINIDDI